MTSPPLPKRIHSAVLVSPTNSRVANKPKAIQLTLVDWSAISTSTSVPVVNAASTVTMPM